MEEVKENKKIHSTIKNLLKKFLVRPLAGWVSNRPGRLMMSSDWHVK